MLIDINSLLSLSTQEQGKCIVDLQLKCTKAFFDLLIKKFNNKKIKSLVNFLLKDPRIKTNSLSMVLYN